LFDNDRPFAEADYAPKPKPEAEPEPEPKPETAMDAFSFANEGAAEISETEVPLAVEPETSVDTEAEEVEVMDLYTQSDVPDPAPIEDDTFDEVIEISDAEEVPEVSAESPEPQPNPVLPKGSGFTLISKKRPSIVSPWGKRKPLEFPEDIPEEAPEAPADQEPPAATTPEETLPEPVAVPASEPDPDPPKLKLGIKAGGSQSELSLDSTPRGRFEGETPNVFNGEDLDLPPFLRKKR